MLENDDVKLYTEHEIARLLRGSKDTVSRHGKRGLIPDDDPIVSYDWIEEQFGWSRTTTWRRVKNGLFPPPLDLGNGSVGWRRSVPIKWLEDRKLVSWAPSDEDHTA
jgi:predicted DNA-binding transcriptional regulator AlpA